MDNQAKIITQGNPGSFHFEACVKYFGKKDLNIISAHSFVELAESLSINASINVGVMAIENSIAGSIIQNFKILRQYSFRIIGEIYLPIQHNLLVIPGTNIDEITEVRSHPMALNQCLKFLRKYPKIKLVSTNDTASSARKVFEESQKSVAAIASKSAADIYGLEILIPQIQTSKINYTRFVVIQNSDKPILQGEYDKASIYIRTKHQKGSLLKVLEKIYEQDINLSKLQSYPVEDSLNNYYFYLDLEFDSPRKYEKAIKNIDEVTEELEVLGVYKRHEVSPGHH